MNIIELETKRIGTRKEKEYESFIESKHRKKKVLAIISLLLKMKIFII
jgi:hypothetical protein